MPPISKGYLCVIAAMLIWGSVGVFVRLADQPAPLIVFVRVTVAFIALGLFQLALRRPLVLGRHRGRAVASGAVLALNWLFFFKSLQATTIGNAVLTYYLAPVMSIVWARLFLGERLERRAAIAAALAAAGIGLMLSGYEFSLSSRDFIGILYGLTGAAFYSLVVVMVKTMPDADPSGLAVIQMGVASAMFLPFAAAALPGADLSRPVSLAALLAMGLIHSALALSLYFTGLKTVKVQHAGILAYIDPVSALVYAYLFFGEALTPAAAAGGLAIIIASLLVIKGQQA